MVSEELMPISVKCIECNASYYRGMKLHKLHMNNPNSKLTRETGDYHQKGFETGILHNNVTLVAMSVKDRVNAILATYHVVAALAHESIGRREYDTAMAIAVGLNFHSMDYLTVCAVPTAPDTQQLRGEPPLVAIPVAPTAPVLDDQGDELDDTDVLPQAASIIEE